MSDILDIWQERAAIMEFDGGMNRFEAETRAAECYGVTRFAMIKELRDADGRGLAGGHGHQPQAVDRERNADHLPGVQRQQEEENGSVPERQQEAGRDRSILLALRVDGGEAV